METIQILADIILALMVIYLGTVERRLSNMQTKVDRSIHRSEVEKLITLELKSVVKESENLKDDLFRIEVKLDKLLDKITKITIK